MGWIARLVHGTPVIVWITVLFRCIDNRDGIAAFVCHIHRAVVGADNNPSLVEVPTDMGLPITVLVIPSITDTVVRVYDS